MRAAKSYERHFGANGVPATALRAFAAFVFIFVLAPASNANTSLFTYTGYSSSVCGTPHYCLQAGDFGVLVGLGTATSPIAATVTSGGGQFSAGSEIGVGAGSTINFTGLNSRTWGGPIDFADPLVRTPSTNCVGNGCALPVGNSLATSKKDITVTGGTVQSAAWVNEAIRQTEAISDYWAGRSGTALTSASFGTIGAGVQVFTTAGGSAFGTLTISGNSNDLIVVNITGSALTTFDHNINLVGGITTDQILFNVTGVNSNGDSLALVGRTLNGTFIVRNDSYTLDTPLNGRVLGGSGAITWGNNMSVTAPEDVSLPEPSTWALSFAGVGALVWVGKRRRNSPTDAQQAR